MMDGWIHNEWMDECSSDIELLQGEEGGVEEMRMGMDIWTDRMREDLAESAVFFHLSVLPSSLSTLHCEQVMNPPYWLFVCFSFCLFSLHLCSRRSFASFSSK